MGRRVSIRKKFGDTLENKRRSFVDSTHNAISATAAALHLDYDHPRRTQDSSTAEMDGPWQGRNVKTGPHRDSAFTPLNTSNPLEELKALEGITVTTETTTTVEVSYI